MFYSDVVDVVSETWHLCFSFYCCNLECILVILCICFAFQGEPGPRGEQGREGSTGPNGDPVRHEHITY